MNMIKSAVIAASVLLASNSMAALDLEWYNVNAISNRFNSIIESDPVGDNPAAGALIQLIRSTDAVNDGVNVGSVGSTAATAGNDTVLAVLWAGAGGVGDGFTYDLQTYAALNASDYIYVRIWESHRLSGSGVNSVTPAPTTAYYDSQIVQGSALPGAAFKTFEYSTPTSPVQWNVVAVPEPATYAFMGIGALLLFVRRMRRS